MTEPTTPSVPAGWYPDPAGSANSRWWDGSQWTGHYQQPYSAGAAAAALRAPEGTKVYSVWIWLIVFLPYLSIPLLFTIDLGGLTSGLDYQDPNASTSLQLQLMTSPGYLALTGLGWLVNILLVFFSWLDWRWLKNAGVPKPFHWAFGFISLAGYPVYAIGRAIVTKRRTGHGSAVLWATIIAFVVAIIVSLAWAFTLVAVILQNTPGLAP